MEFTFELNKTQFEKMENILLQELIDVGVHSLLLIDLAGNILISLNDGKPRYDVHSLAALAAGNFGTVSQIARIIGETDFSLLFHEGARDSIHFSRVGDDLLLITIFGKDVSLGFLRLKVGGAIEKITALL